MSKYFYIVTYGCQMNVHESEKIAGLLSEMGYLACKTMEEADLIVFNTCCIRENAENHAFGNIGMLKKLKARKKELIIAVGGCLPQQMGKADDLHGKFPYVDVIFGTHNLNRLKELILKKSEQKKTVIEIENCNGEIIEDVNPLRTSYPNAWVNIMYGCDNFCSYCIVPYVRGRERSRRSEHVIAEVKKLINDGYKEITLLGQNVNSYSNGTDDISFAQLLENVASTEGKFRLRFMTSHPKDFSEDIVKAISRFPKICRAVHLPVQSGSDRILKLMNRKYTVSEYMSKLELLKKYVPDCAVTTDLIVGFPGETEEDFKSTLNLVKEAGFSSAFTFVYSKREGTVAAKMDGQIPSEVSKERIMRLVDLVNSQTREQSLQYVGKSVEILCEGYDDKKRVYMGRDEYGRMAYFSSDAKVVGEFLKVKISGANGVSLTGDIEKE